MTHYPTGPWCPICIKNVAQNNRHRKANHQRETENAQNIFSRTSGLFHAPFLFSRKHILFTTKTIIFTQKYTFSTVKKTVFTQMSIFSCPKLVFACKSRFFHAKNQVFLNRDSCAMVFPPIHIFFNFFLPFWKEGPHGVFFLLFSTASFNRYAHSAGPDWYTGLGAKLIE